MNAERLQRRLAAILSADVKGYSRLMGEDEEATVRTLTDYRKVISDLVDGHGGRVVDSPGDNILAEFPSAVLPFENMSGDPGQEYFSDGITEEIITGLAKTPKLFVIARNSSFAYKGKAEKVQNIARELGVHYLLEGSIRKAGERVRITAQLIDGLTGRHLWAERYDRDLKDIFAVQDEITINVMRNMQVKLTEGEQACHWLRHGSANLDAYEKVMKGMELFRRFSPDGNQQARRFFQEAAALDPGFPGAYVMQSWSHLLDVMNGWAGSPEKAMERAGELAGKALEIDESEPETHALLGNIHLLMREYVAAVEEGERAVRLNPNGADAYVWLAMILIAVGRSDEAVTQMQKALRLNPLPPNWYHWTLGNAYFWTKRYEKSVEEYQKALENSPDFLGAQLGILGAYQLLGRKGEVEATVAEILRIFPQFSLEHFAATMIFKNPEDVDFLMKTLRQAGLK